MHSAQLVFSASALLVAACAVITSGCWPIDFASDCEHIGTCPISLVTNTACIPSKNASAVSESCGVFTSDSLGDDTAGDGTKDKPFKTLATAFMRANGKPVYACSETFAEAVVMSAGSELYGGLDCTQGWIYGGETARTTISPGADQVPITLSTGLEPITVENILARSADALTSGGASVAVKADDGSTADLTRCDLVAGNGAEGEPGMAGDPNGMPAASGLPGNSGGMACTADTVPGGSQAITDCGGVMSVGGGGGNGQITSGGSGDTGTPNLGAGQGGTGDDGSPAWSCLMGGGTIGANGTPGTPGTGATTMGTLTASGYAGTSGTAGTPGTPGQGGGGGGGAKGGMACSGSTKGGASGGSGGSGGCSGLPGGGGGPGGASIGLVSFNATLTLTDCTITAGNGGPGGKGGDLQAGGPGGLGGLGGMAVGGLNPGCDGGKGGKGGDGGPGGGGLGGPSFAIAHVGDAPEQRGTVTLTKGGGGPGGLGGNNGIGMNDGAPGISAELQAF